LTTNPNYSIIAIMENKEMTSEERIALIRDAHLASKSFKGNAFVEEFVAEEKTAEVVSRHGLIEVSLEDIKEEGEFLHSDSAEDIDEEEQSVGISDQMREVAGQSLEREYELDIGECAHNIATTSFNNKEWHGQTEGKTDFTLKMISHDHTNNQG
jgi:hypothetical protein